MGSSAGGQAVFRPVTVTTSKAIRRALPAMVLAFLLAPHRRSLKTIGRMVVGHRCHVGTISRRLDNPRWQTRDWYRALYAQTLTDVDRWERRQAKQRRRRWFVVIDTTYHESVGECMESMIVMSRRKHPARRTTRHHAFVMGMLLTDRGARLPLPRKSYYTQGHCRKHRRRHYTQPELAAVMIRELKVRKDVEVMVLFEGAFDASVVHRACRKRRFQAVFPLDPNRVLAREGGRMQPVFAERGWWNGRGTGRARSLRCWSFRWTTKRTSSCVADTSTT